MRAFLEGRHRFTQRMPAGPVQQVEIDPVGPKPLQARFAGSDRALVAGIGRQHLGDEENLVAPAADGFAGHCFRTAIRIHLRRVDQRHAAVDARLQGADFRRGVLAAFTHVPGPEPEGRDPGPVGKANLGHWLGHDGLLRPVLSILSNHRISIF
jgi:hypothetical protein